MGFLSLSAVVSFDLGPMTICGGHSPTHQVYLNNQIHTHKQNLSSARFDIQDREALGCSIM